MLGDIIGSKRVEWFGKVYDSQLEADWACTLDSWGLDVTHHPGRIQLSTGWWEPDFLCGDVMLEVKGPGGERLWKPAEAEQTHGLGVVVLRPGLVMPGSDNETAGATWHGTQPSGEEWVVEWPAGGKPRFTRAPDPQSEIRVSAERCIVRPEVVGLGMRKALTREVPHHV